MLCVILLDATPINLIQTRLKVIKDARHNLLIYQFDVRIHLLDDALYFIVVLFGKIALLLCGFKQRSVHF